MLNLATQTRSQLIGQSQGPLTMSDLLDLSRPTLVKGDFDLSDISNIVCLSTGPTTISLKNTRPGQYGSLIAGQGAGTARYTVPTGWTVTYAGATSNTSFPACKFAGAKINFVRTGPSSVDITGEYATSVNAWHPTTEGDDCLFVMHAGYGTKYQAVANDTEDVVRPTSAIMTWFPRWSSQSNARFSFDAALDVDNISYGGKLETDAAFDSGVSYLGRAAAAQARKWQSTVYPQTGAWRFFLAVRQLATGQGPAQVFKITDTLVNGGFGTMKAGLCFIIDTNRGYQFLHDKSAVAWGTKTGTFSTHENTTNAVLISGVIGSDGNVALYSGTQKITQTASATGAATVDRFELYPGAFSSNFGGVAVLNGTSSNLALEQAYFADLFI